MKILNLYCGIGGNRKLWGDEHDVTAVEIDSKIAKIYQDFFPNDKVIVEDAHKYLLEHYKEFDFIWSSPPCPTHSLLRNSHPEKVVYPDMKLYEEIIILQKWSKGLWVIENVKSYYDPLIIPKELQRHYFWSNFNITLKKINKIYSRDVSRDTTEELSNNLGFKISEYSGVDKRKLLRNCVNPELGLHILNCAIGKQKQTTLNLNKEKLDEK